MRLKPDRVDTPPLQRVGQRSLGRNGHRRHKPGLAKAVEGSILTFSDKTVMKVREINIDMDKNGYITDWRVDVEYLSGGKPFKQDSIRLQLSLVVPQQRGVMRGGV